MSDNTVAVLDSVSRFLDRQHGLYIDGQWRASAAEGRLAVYNPANGQQIATTADANEHDVALAVQSAHKAFSEGVWAQRLPVERERILLRFADLVEQHAEELAQLETLEQGKSINIARAFEVGSTLNWMRYTAGLATKSPVKRWTSLFRCRRAPNIRFIPVKSRSAWSPASCPGTSR